MAGVLAVDIAVTIRWGSAWRWLLCLFENAGPGGSGAGATGSECSWLLRHKACCLGAWRMAGIYDGLLAWVLFS